MWSTKQKAAVGGVVAAVVIGGGSGFAVAHASDNTGTPTASATSSPTGSATTGTTGKAAKPAKAAKAGEAKDAVIGSLKDFQHAEWVTKESSGFVTHDAILGKVTAVSATSVSVLAADGTSMTFAVDTSTTVHKAGAKAAAGRSTSSPTSTATASAPAGAATATIADVTVGQTVLLSGAKSPDLVATTVMVRAS